jgi:5'-3' exoribonuclease 2
MNQQRSRRFRAAQEAQEKEESKQESMKLFQGEPRTIFRLQVLLVLIRIPAMCLEQGGKYTEEEKEKLKKKGWDTNAITPGEPATLDHVFAAPETDTLHRRQVHLSWICSQPV